MLVKETAESRKVRLAKEAAEKIRIEKVEQSLAPEVLSVVKSSEKFPAFVGRLRTHHHHTDECKVFCLLGFGKKDPRIIVVEKEKEFFLVQLSI